MNAWINNTRIIIIALGVLFAAYTTYRELHTIRPAQRCEARHAWWDPRDRQCLDPIPIWRITGRTLPKAPTSTTAQ